MISYKLQISSFTGTSSSVSSSNGWNIPFDSANTDYQRFKNKIQGIGENGESIPPAQLKDADGNVMTTEQVKQFIATLP